MPTRRSLLAAPAALLFARGEGAKVLRHVRVYAEKGRFGGWPANHGIWSWGEEILCGFSAAYFMKKDPERHQYDNTRPEEPRLARSRDGGETWKIEAPPSLLPPEQGGSPVEMLAGPMDFTAPGFAMTIRFTNVHAGESRLWHSADRGKTWSGPFRFPLFGRKGIAARTDYIVLNKSEALVFVTSAKENGREGRPVCVRTGDGGLTWAIQGWIGPEPEGFAIMPSSVRLPGGRILTAVRVKQDETADWIDLWASEDLGKTWSYVARPVPKSGGKSGNPPSLVRLQDGRLVITYGYRGKPFSIRAVISGDDGKTWSPDIILRDDGGAWDIGYTRSVQRPDGNIVTLYYFPPAPFVEREIAATIWNAGKRGAE
jgi:hypothetical protein